MEQIKRNSLRERSTRLGKDGSALISQQASKSMANFYMPRLSHAKIQQGACMHRVINVLQNQIFLGFTFYWGQCRHTSTLTSMKKISNCNSLMRPNIQISNLGETPRTSNSKWIKRPLTPSKTTFFGPARAIKSQQWSLARLHISMITTKMWLSECLWAKLALRKKKLSGFAPTLESMPPNLPLLPSQSYRLPNLWWVLNTSTSRTMRCLIRCMAMQVHQLIALQSRTRRSMGSLGPRRLFKSILKTDSSSAAPTAPTFSSGLW